jgi:hypothetical protein
MTSPRTIGEAQAEALLASWRFVSARVRILPPVYRRELIKTIGSELRDIIDDLREVTKS